MDEINKTIENINLGAVEIDDDAMPVEQDVLNAPGAPTNRSDKLQGKHALTPESKASAESRPKRFAPHTCNLSSKQCSDRRSIVCEELRKFVIGKLACTTFVKQNDLLNLLNLEDKDKSLLTRCVKICFPNSAKKYSENEIIYTNIAIMEPSHSASISTSSSSNVVKKLFTESSNEITEIQSRIAEMEEHLKGEWETVADALDSDDVKKAKLSALKYQTYLKSYCTLNTALSKHYENKLEKLEKVDLEYPVSMSQKQKMAGEIKELENLCSFGLRMEGDIDCVIHEKIFLNLLENVEVKCPLIYSILQTLLVSDTRKRVHKSPEYKIKCGVNALALLLSVRNQRFSNDVRLMFGLLCITYGAGKQFVNMLHRIGLTPHWDTLSNFLDHRLDQLRASISEKCNDATPIILLMDNINMYRGRKRHNRLFQDIGPKMWNFTGCAAIIPDMSDIVDLLSCQETTLHPQVDIKSIKPKDIFLESMPEHKMLWEKWCDRYFLHLLNKSLNDIPLPPRPFIEMNEAEIHTWLQSVNVEEVKERKYNVKIASVDELCKNRQSVKKTNILNLPLSIEDNATLTGTAAILDEFAKDFGIPCDKPNGYIEFDSTEKEFDLKAARERFLFMKSIQKHRVQMEEFEKQILSGEKDIVQTDAQFPDENSESDESDNDEDMNQDKRRDTSNTKDDDKFHTLFKQLRKQAQDTVDSCDDNCLDKLVEDLQKKNKKLNSTRDNYERTILHAAVEARDHTLVNILLASGVNPNAKEGCGATPMSIAVINSDLTSCKLLLNNFGEYLGAFFGGFPSPLEMAIAMDLNEIVDLFNSFLGNIESPVVTLIQSENASFTSCPSTNTDDEQTSNDTANGNASNVDFVYKRSECKEFPTAVVGDVGTCKNNRSVKNRDVNAYGWCAEIPGDMHAKGYLCEATFKAHGSSGFHKIVNGVMKRPKLTKEAYKKRKFQDQNLNRIQESVRDASLSYGMAAVMEFRSSSSFPSDRELKMTMQRFGSHNTILLERFKKWLRESAEVDESHKHHQQLFTLFGPLLELFNTAGKQGDGFLREVVWIIMLPIFAQLNFRNYWTEAFVHVVNLTALWPLAFREMIRKNSTVNLNGNTGHNLDLDEYVETYIVRPLKTYVSGHTSVQTCRRLMGSLSLFGSARAAYSNPLAFDHHPTAKHKEQTPFPDQLKGMWFCLKNFFFKVENGRVPLQYPLQSVTDVMKPVSKAFVEVKEKGEQKVKEKFEQKLHDCFPAFRVYSLDRLLAADNDTI